MVAKDPGGMMWGSGENGLKGSPEMGKRVSELSISSEGARQTG